jgi:hypothetical protein
VVSYGGVDHEERNGSLGCWRKCLNFMKTGLRVDELACRIANEWGQLVCDLGKLHRNSGGAWQIVTLGCYSFVGVQTRLRTLIS